MHPGWERAVSRGDSQHVERLVRHGADVNARDRWGRTALMTAAHGGHRALVELLIAHSADLDVTAKYGLSALMLAVIGRHEVIARLLAAAGADLAIRGTGAPGFEGMSAHDLALDADLRDLAAELAPDDEAPIGTRPDE